STRTYINVPYDSINYQVLIHEKYTSEAICCQIPLPNAKPNRNTAAGRLGRIEPRYWYTLYFRRKETLFGRPNPFCPCCQGKCPTEVYRCRPASTGTIDPVVCVKWVIEAITANATSCASIARLSGVASAALAIISSVRPGTKPVWTMPGATTTTRISGPSTRASAMLIVLSAALEAP